MYLSKWLNIFVWITQYISSKLLELFVWIIQYVCPTWWMYLSKLLNIFVQHAKCQPNLVGHSCWHDLYCLRSVAHRIQIILFYISSFLHNDDNNNYDVGNELNCNCPESVRKNPVQLPTFNFTIKHYCNSSGTIINCSFGFSSGIESSPFHLGLATGARVAEIPTNIDRSSNCCNSGSR